MNVTLKALLITAAVALTGQAAAQATFYEHDGFAGRSFSASGPVPSFDRHGMNDRTSSVVIVGRAWELCHDADHGGACVVLPPGRYASLSEFGLNDRVSSARVAVQAMGPVDPRRPAAPVPAGATFYEREGFDGRSFTAASRVEQFRRSELGERAESVVVSGERWEVCDGNRFRGRCMVLRPGRYASLAAMGLDDGIASARIVQRDARIGEDRYAPAPLTGELTFYERENYAGRSFTTQEPVANLRGSGFNDRAASAVVLGDRWEVCDDAQFGGRCFVLRPGRYPSLATMGLSDRISSARAVATDARIRDERYAPLPAPVYDSRRRGGERLHEVAITSSRAVLATSGQRCWVETEQVEGERERANVGAAVAGAIIGGILGHQVGGGSGQKVATVGGAVAGAAVGSQIGRDRGQPTTQDVQRCEDVPGGAQPAYWDVGYSFRGQDHRVQMAVAPGRTIMVNDQGQPRQ